VLVADGVVDVVTWLVDVTGLVDEDETEECELDAVEGLTVEEGDVTTTGEVE